MKVQKRYVISLLATALILFLTNKFWLICNSGHHRFVFETFTIILVLFFLLFYKVFDYLADFKSVENKSRIEIVFLTIFFVFLFVPMSHINQEVKSIQENRTFAKWKPLITTKGTINYNFGKDFDKWFSDRFYLRKELIDLNFLIQMKISRDFLETNDFMINKTNGFCYKKASDSIAVYQRNKLFSKQELDIIKQNLLNVKRFCDENNIKLYLVFENDKESLYPEFYSKKYIQKNNITRLHQTIDFLKTIPDLKLISTENKMLEAKANGVQVFCKTDSHNAFYDENPRLMLSQAAYIAYNEIVSEIKKDFSTVKIIPFNNLEKVKIKNKTGDIIHSSILSKYFQEDLDVFVLEKPNTKYQLENNYFIYTNSKPENDLKIVVIGDSFTGRYIAILSESFKITKRLFKKGKEPLIIKDSIAQDLFIKEKPDILVLQTTERFIDKFLTIDLRLE